MTKKLRISPDLTLPVDAVTETFALLAKRGAGKSNAAVVMAEQMYDAGLPWVAIDPKGDWWGIRSSANGRGEGLPVLVLGGQHGDVPLEPTAGQLVADLIVEQRLTCVVDVSVMSKADMRRFLADFAERLYTANTDPLHVFAEEAHEYIPQRVDAGAARMVGAWEKLVKWGRTHGLGVTLITQRSASLNKDVLTQVETLIALRTTGPQDQAAIRAWVDEHESGAAMIAQLRKLSNGEAFVLSPQWLELDEPARIRFDRRRTFDSGATPRAGEKRITPKTLAEVDLAALKEAMAETIEKAKADDPKVLRARIRDLERELAAERAKPTPDPVVERLEVKVVDEPTIARIRDDLAGPLLTELRILTEALDSVHRLPQEGNQGSHGAPSSARRATSPSSSPVRGAGAGSSDLREKPSPGHQRETRPATDPGEAPQLKAGARRLLETLARHHPMRVTKAQLGTLAKFKITGGTFQTYWSTLKRHGLVDDNGTDIGLTAAGMDYVGYTPAAPMTTEELLDQWRSSLKAGARDMLNALVHVYPDGFTRDQLAFEVGMTASGGTFQTYLSTLRRNGLADVVDGYITASETLFLGGAA